MSPEGKKVWIIADGFLPAKSNGQFKSHEAVCLLNTGEREARVNITVYFEDREPLNNFTVQCGAQRTNHVRLDKIKNKEGRKIPTGVPYALKLISSEPVVVQHSRMDTSQPEMSLMTTTAY